MSGTLSPGPRCNLTSPIRWRNDSPRSIEPRPGQRAVHKAVSSAVDRTGCVEPGGLAQHSRAHGAGLPDHERPGCHDTNFRRRRCLDCHAAACADPRPARRRGCGPPGPPDEHDRRRHRTWAAIPLYTAVPQPDLDLCGQVRGGMCITVLDSGEGRLGAEPCARRPARTSQSAELVHHLRQRGRRRDRVQHARAGEQGAWLDLTVLPHQPGEPGPVLQRPTRAGALFSSRSSSGWRRGCSSAPVC